MKSRKCNYCDAQIFFGVSAKGRMIPLEIKRTRVTLFNFVQDPVRRDPVEPKLESVTISGFVSHFGTCPGSDRARADAQEKRDATTVDELRRRNERGRRS